MSIWPRLTRVDFRDLCEIAPSSFGPLPPSSGHTFDTIHGRLRDGATLSMQAKSTPAKLAVELGDCG
jgi:hypothetical protein